MQPAGLVHPGQSLADGRYLLVRKVAEGGTAIVHLGYDTWTEQWRAVKTLLPDYAKRAALRHRFEREAATMKGLSHENVVAVYDAGVDGDVAFMVMEYAEAGSVIDWIERYGPMPPRMACEVTLQLCAGIQAAHVHNIIHRDVKPQNLLVDRYGRCKVTDFGIAQVRQDTRMTMTGTVMGTIGYMAPEQHESAKHADERADVYSIAATFYTLLKGEAATHLFMAEDADFIGIAPPLAQIIRQGAEYRREARHDSVPAFAEAVQAALRLLPPDPLDTPPLVSEDTPLLDDITPPSFHTTRSPHADAGGYVPLGAPEAVPMPTHIPASPAPAGRAHGSSEPYPSPASEDLYRLEDLYPPEALRSEEGHQPLVLIDQPLSVDMPDHAATPSLPTRDELTSDQHRPTPRPLARWERPATDSREWLPWVAVGVIGLGLLVIGVNVLVANVNERIFHKQVIQARDVAIVQFRDDLTGRVHDTLEDLVGKVPVDVARTLASKFRIDDQMGATPAELLGTSRRVYGVLAEQVIDDTCVLTSELHACKQLRDATGHMEKKLDDYDESREFYLEWCDQNWMAWCSNAL